ncbi:MAG TPA: flavodoxin family protein [bacterium]|nr:flavodoxin family protein [bacterium]
MKVLAINGSARRDGNTAIMLDTVLAEMPAGTETNLIQLAGMPLRGCTACRRCAQTQDRRCAVKGDSFNDIFAMMTEADAIILGSPVYVAGPTPEIKMLIDRACVVARANHGLMRRKLGAAVVAQRRGGAVSAFDALNHFFFISEMIVVGSNYWNMGFGGASGEVKDDAEGLETMRVLGRNLAWLLPRVVGQPHA